MAVLTSLILYGILGVVISKECIIEPPREEIWRNQLIDDLNCNYHVFWPPKSNKSDPLPVTASFKVRYFNIDSEEEVLLMYDVSMTLIWMDARLKWEPTNYDGIKEIKIHSGLIWTPSIRLINTADTSDYDRFFLETCTLNKTGNVTCTIKQNYEAICQGKLSNYPYDSQECSLEFGSSGSNNGNISLKFSSRAMSLEDTENSTQWIITDYKQRSEKNKMLIMTFILDRQANSLAAVIVYPCLIVSCLTIVSLFLNVRNNLRLIFVCFSIFSHYYWLVELGETIPTKSVDPPKLLLYYRGSMILSVLTLMITFVLNVMCKKQTVPQNIILNINNFFQGNYVKFLMLSRWNLDGAVNSDNHNVVWINFANIINSICSIAIIIAYIVMYCLLVPRPIHTY